MLAKLWRKILLFILIVACLFNVITKFVKKSSLNEELLTSAEYVKTLKEK